MLIRLSSMQQLCHERHCNELTQNQQHSSHSHAVVSQLLNDGHAQRVSGQQAGHMCAENITLYAAKRPSVNEPGLKTVHPWCVYFACDELSAMTTACGSGYSAKPQSYCQ
eukprot:32725-Chlamydomonas_euryale.AAC.16